MTEPAASVDDYIAEFPPEIAERLQQVRAAILAGVAGTDGNGPEERTARAPRR